MWLPVWITLGILAYWFVGCLWGSLMFRMLKNHESWETKEAYEFSILTAFIWPVMVPFVSGLILIEWLGDR